MEETANKKRPLRKKPITALAGALFLVWLFFSPIIASLVVSSLFRDFNFFHIFIASLIAYVALGFFYYRICRYFGGIFAKVYGQPIILSDAEKENIKPDNHSELFKMATLAILPLVWGFVIRFASMLPIFSGIFGLTLLIATCLANWYLPLRKKVNYWLSFGIKNEAMAYARAEEILYALNGLFITSAGFLMAIYSLYLFP